LEPAKAGTTSDALEEVERRHVEAVLAQTNWMLEPCVAKTLSSAETP
jgi:hypothetical protein